MHLSQIKILSGLIFSSILISCKTEEPIAEKNNYIAKVGNSFLTKESILNMEESKKYSGKFVDEIINDWIERELLFLIANDEGITKENAYTELVQQSKKELAASLYLEKYFENYLISVTESEIQNYFSLNQKEFRLKNDAYFLNIARFVDFQTAEKFREEVINTSWLHALTKFSNMNNLLSYEKDYFIYRHQINPIKLIRSIDILNEGEISLSVQSNEGNYVVVQLISKINSGEIPTYDLVREDVRNRYFAKKKKELYKKLISELAEKYEIVINKDKIND